MHVQCQNQIRSHNNACRTTLLRKLGGKVDLTVLPEGDHFIADQVYGDPKLQQWLISQSRRETSVVA